MRALILFLTFSASVFATEHPFKNKFSNVLDILEKYCTIYTELAYTSCFSDLYNRADFVVYRLNKISQLKIAVFSRPKFYNDPRIPQVDKADYKDSGYDKGHLAFHRGFSFNEAKNYSTYNVALNIVPMLPKVNRGQWAKIESIALKLAREIEVDVIDIMIPSNKFLNGKNINIPRTMIKILILDTHFRCFVVSNEKPEANKTPERDCNFVLDIINKETARERIAVK